MWTVAITGSTTVDGDNVARVTMGTLDTETGEITNGDIGEASEFGYNSSRHINQISTDSDGSMVWYRNQTDDLLFTASWGLPIG
jgi:hypothetical protein